MGSRPALPRRGGVRGARWSVAALGVVASFVTAACREVLGIEPRRKDARIGRCSEVVYASAECAECMDGACCDEIAACAADDACAAVAACNARCAPEDADCRIACGVTSSPPTTTLGALDACRRASCIETCIEASSYLDDRGAECVACARGPCDELATTCAATPQCDEAVRCTEACSNPTCNRNCGTGVGAEARTLALRSLTCAGGCAACRYGENFDCSGDYKLQPPTKETATLTIPVTLNAEPLDGARVSVCGVTDTACAHPIAPPETTTHGGVATIVVPLSTVQPFSGIIEVASGDLLPTLVAIDALAEDRYYGVAMVTATQIATGALVVGESFDPAVDVVVGFLPFDCRLEIASAIRFSLDPPYDAVRVYYGRGGLPSEDATETDGGPAYAIIHTMGEPLPNPRLSFRAIRTKDDDDQIVGTGTAALRVGALAYALSFPPDSP